MLSSGRDVVRAAFERAITPPDALTVSEWSDRHRVLSSESASEHGAWRTSRTPYLREIMDCLSLSSTVNEVALMKGAQVGGSEAMINAVGYTIDKDACAMMIVLPTVDLAKFFSTQRLEPMLVDSPVFDGVIGASKSRDRKSSTTLKKFPGGLLRIVGANSAAGLRSMPARKLLLDEVDVYPADVDGEGDPIELARARTRTFKARRKIVAVSTPTLEGASRIQRLFEDGDQSYYHVPCPECESLEVLKWSSIQFERDAKGELVEGSTRWACPSCGSLVEEFKKTEMLRHGRWIAKRPERSERSRSFHLSSLYSPVGWYSWEDAARDFIKASKPGNVELLRVWINTVLGETWAEKGQSPPWERLFNRREAYRIGVVPSGVSIVTAGVDVQADRLEVEVVGWGAGFESWSIDYRVFMGRPEDPEVWQQLDHMLEAGYPTAAGGRAPIARVAVDSGYATQEVYAWGRRKRLDQVLVVKGGPDSFPVLLGLPRKVDTNAKGKRVRRGIQLWTVGTGLAKSELYGWLGTEQPTDVAEAGWPRGWCHFPQYGEEYFKQLCAEVLVPRIKRSSGSKRETGRVYVWEKKRERNEVLDCRVYARAALTHAGADRWRAEDWAIAAEILAGGAPQAGPAPEPRKRRKKGGGSWLGRYN